MNRSDPQRYDELLSEHARLVASAIRRVCGRRHQALVPDVEQEVRIALWKRLQGGNPIRHPVSYLYKTALTTALSVVRRQGAIGAELREEDRPAELVGARAPGGLLPAERTRLLQQVLAELAPDERRALEAYLAGFSHVEVAALYGWSEPVARHRIYRTLGRLRDAARRAEEEEP